MKIVQISDLHSVDPGQKIGEIDPFERLTKAVEHINNHHGDAEFCAVTGDLTDKGSVQAYRQAKLALDKLSMPYYPILGNHDLRKPFFEVFTDHHTENGHVNFSVNGNKNVFIFLDTLKEYEDFGEFCEHQVKWLGEQFEQVKHDQCIFLFMHHPPFSVSIPCIDSIKLKDTEQFYNSIKSHSIRYLFFGHIHRPSCGTWRNIPYSSNRSIGHYQICTHKKAENDFPMTQESPMYSVIFISDDQVHIDMQDYLNDEVKFKT